MVEEIRLYDGKRVKPPFASGVGLHY